jgi:predicted nucleic acid-binding protein
MGKRYLIDTNVILDYMGNKLPEKPKSMIARIIDHEINLSVINKIELLGFKELDQDLIDFIDCSIIYPLDDEVVDKTIHIRRKDKIKLPDAIIAATAIHHGFILITNNTRDFKNIVELEMVNPYEM